MTDRELATALLVTTNLESVAREDGESADREAIRTVRRHAIALKGALERLISARVVRTWGQKTG